MLEARGDRSLEAAVAVAAGSVAVAAVLGAAGVMDPIGVLGAVAAPGAGGAVGAGSSARDDVAMKTAQQSAADLRSLRRITRPQADILE